MGPHDKVFEIDGIKVVVDKKSYIYLNGTTLDYVTQGLTGGFTFVNPQAKSSCGCGPRFRRSRARRAHRTGPARARSCFSQEGYADVTSSVSSVSSAGSRSTGPALQRRFYELSRQWHPDFHARPSAASRPRAGGVGPRERGLPAPCAIRSPAWNT
jgi:hypothetical protein